MPIFGTAVILERGGRVLLLQRSMTMSWMPGRWNLPGGHVDPGENAAQCATREVFEETGLVVQTLAPLVRVQRGKYIVDFFHTTNWDGQLRLNGENTQAIWVARERAHEADLIPPQGDVLQQLVR